MLGSSVANFSSLNSESQIMSTSGSSALRAYVCGSVNTGVVGDELNPGSRTPKGSRPASVAIPTLLQSLKASVRSIALGEGCLIAVTDDGVFAVGRGSRNRLGTGKTADMPHFVPVPFPPGSARITQVAMGQWHGLALSSDGSVY